ncbi:MAG: DegT/DnrJ/EryC1/StrS family aminotransferase [bacterium]|nr:DegT/DnrJ/EryC1/StrS family aminotransferase [bacterium]
MKVPQLDLRTQYQSLKNEILPKIEEHFANQSFILGPTVDHFEKSMAEYLGVPDCVGLASGSEALRVALAMFDVGPGDEVLLPSFTFFATAGAVIHAGATPVFVDVDEDFLMDITDAAQLITAKTRVILPVHLYGRQLPWRAWRELADAHGLRLLEDAAQSVGSRDDMGRSGALGDLAAFSFFPTKNLGGAGDGGLLSGLDPELLARARLFRNHGAQQRYYHSEVGINGRLDALQAAVLQVKLGHIDEWNRQRRARAARYNQLIDEAGLASHVTCPRLPRGEEHVFHQYTLRVGNRDPLLTRLHENEIGAAIYYPVPLHRQECFKELPSAQRSLPVTERLTEEVLSLPIYPELTDEQQVFVVDVIREFFAD